MEQNYFHSVTLDKDKCRGCTNCIKHCPTEAIRVRAGKAVIIKERCIDCGECIRICPYHAKKAVTDTIGIIRNYEYKIALPAPSLYGQFGPTYSRERILKGLLGLGFDHIFEVARAAEIVTMATQKYLKNPDIKKPIISSACPAVVRLIQVRFPSLIDRLLRIKSPMEVAAALAKREALAKGIPEGKIGTFFISPCAAKVTSVKAPYENNRSDVDGVLAIKDIYVPLLEKMKKQKAEGDDGFSLSGSIGITWAGTGGESSALNGGRYIAVHGIRNVNAILEQTVQGSLEDIEFIEALACPEGCLGGPLVMENPFVAKVNLRNEARRAPVRMSEEPLGDDEEYIWQSTVEYRPIMKLDDDMAKALEKMQRMDELTDILPGLDCGACGAPSCRALAEDIVMGNAILTDCIIKLREKVDELESGSE